MYTARATPIGRLKSYQAELQYLYQAALRRGDVAAAQAIFQRRRRVTRAILQAIAREPVGRPELN
jgi:hypothetical protein